MASVQVSKFVVSLTRDGRRENRQQELEDFLLHDPQVNVIEGFGKKTLTVAMPSSHLDRLQGELPFATVDPYQKLKLLSVNSGR